MTARAVIVLRVNASGNGMCGVLLSYIFINFAQVTAGVGVFLRSFYQLLLKFCFSLVSIRFSCGFPFSSEQI